MNQYQRRSEKMLSVVNTILIASGGTVFSIPRKYSHRDVKTGGKPIRQRCEDNPLQAELHLFL